ncbi:MAG: PAS domain S-box protein [Fibrobacteria bacterium]
MNRTVFQCVFESAPDPVFLVDEKGDIVQPNQEAERAFGYSRGELQGMSFDELLAGNLVDNRLDYHPGFMASARANPLGVEMRLLARRKDGTEFPVEMVLSVTDSVQGPIHIASLKDTSEREAAARLIAAARQREMDLLELAPDAIFISDLEGKYFFVNSSGCRMLGMERKEILGKSILDFFPREDAWRLAVSRAEMMGGEARTEEWRLRHKDGTFIPVEVSARIFPDGRWQGFARDIRERKQAERKQAELICGLQESLKEIRVLRGLLPICAHCKKIRDEVGAWQQIELYIRSRSEAEFSHGICPECLKNHFGEFVLS